MQPGLEAGDFCGAGVSEGKSEWLCHRRGGAPESPVSGNQGQCQSQPVSRSALVNLAPEREGEEERKGGSVCVRACACGVVCLWVCWGLVVEEDEEEEGAEPLYGAVQAVAAGLTHTKTHRCEPCESPSQ